MDHPQRTGSVAERSKALVLGTSLFGGVGSNPTTAINVCIQFGNMYLLAFKKALLRFELRRFNQLSHSAI